MKFRFLLSLVTIFFIKNIVAQQSITNLSTPYTQDFNSLANTGTPSSTLPANWFISNATYTVGTGSSNTGALYSFGSTGNSDRALGSLGSTGNANGKFGMNFTNNTSNNIQTLTITYTGEMWRLGSGSPLDSLHFSYSTDASSLANGTWTDVTQLNFITPDTTGIGRAVNGNIDSFRRNITYTISGLNIPPSATFWIRWQDYNSLGSDDGLAIDDLTVSYSGVTLPNCVTPTQNVTNKSFTSTITSFTGNFTKAIGSQKTLVVYSTSPQINANPTNGTSYTIGQNFSNGIVAYVGNATNVTFTVSGLTENTSYTCFYFPFNDSCSNGPIYKTLDISLNYSDSIRTKRLPIVAPYYSTVDTNQTCANLKTALKNRILNNHVPITYAQILTAFASTDLQAGFIIDRYTACQYTYTTASCSGNSETPPCQCYNRDHVVPQSWFGDWDNYPMYSDMHHIFPSDGYINSAKKGNLPLGIASASTGVYTTSNGTKIGNSTAANGYTGEVFEPNDTYKGDFARTYLYFVTRYQDSIATFKSRYPNSVLNSTNYSGLDAWNLKIMVQWHKQDPPSDLEVLRNDSVFRIQGNRNPFIDYPHWVEKVFGTNGDACGLYVECTQPDTIPTNITITNVTNNSISGKFNKPIGGADGYVVIYRKAKTQLPQLRDSINYNVGQLVTQVNGTFIDSAIVADTSLNVNDTTFTITGLDSSSRYYIAVIPYNRCDYGKNYLNYFLNNVNKDDTTTLGVVATTCGDPTQAPANLTFTSVTLNSISGKFNQSVGGADGYLIIYRKNNSFLPTIRDSANYTVGQIITSISTNGLIDSAKVGDISSNATDTTFTISGLDSSATYWIAVIPFNNCSFGKSYRSVFIPNVNKNDTTTLGVNTTPCSQPAAVPNNIKFTNITSNSISGTFGKVFTNTDGYIVIYRKNNSNLPTPKDSAIYSVGQLVTSTSGLFTDSAYVGHISTNNNDTSFTITGLDSISRYYFAVFPYNFCSGFGNKYNIVIINNVNKDDTSTLGTACIAPSTSVATLNFTNITTNSISGNFSNISPTPAGYLVVYSTNGFITFPRDTTVQYVAGQLLGTGNQQATVLKVCSPSDTTFTATGLNVNTKYHFFVFPFNNCSGTIKIRRTTVKRDSVITLNATTPCTEPNAASNITITSASSTQINGSFTASSPSANAYLVLRSSSATIPTITDASIYAVGQTIGSATVVANGTNTTFAATGLNPSTRYYFFVFAYNNVSCIGGPNYNTTSVAQKDTVTDFSSGIKINKETAFKIFPNPVSNGRLNLQFDSNLINDAQVRIVDMLGKVMHQEILPQYSKTHQIDVNMLSKGIYYLQIGDNSNFSTIPFMKQ
jgi:endonuclease I